MRNRVRPLPLAVASAAVLAVGIGAWSPASQADTTPAACTSVGPSLTDFTATLTLPKFDPALGTLTAVTLSGSTSMHARIRVENTSATSDTVGASIAFNSELGLPAGQTIPTELTYGHTETVPAFDGVLDFAGSGFDTGPVETSKALPPYSLSGGDITPFVGPGTFDSSFSALGRTQGFGSGNQVNRILVEGAATVCVAYTYTLATTTTTSTVPPSTTSTTLPPTSSSTIPSTSTSTSTTTPRTTTTVAPTTSTTVPCTTTTTAPPPTSTTTPLSTTSTSTPATTSTTTSTTVPPHCPPSTTTSTTAPVRTTTTVRPEASTTTTQPGSTATTEAEVVVEPTTLETIVEATPTSPVTPVTSTGTNLPRTGSQPFPLLMVGAGLLGTGASLLAWRRNARDEHPAADA